MRFYGSPTAYRGPHPEVFFFQAEDGIRDYKVTGVTCALPISRAVAGETPGHALVRAGNGIECPVARRSGALRAQPRRRNAVRRPRRGWVKEHGRRMAPAAIAPRGRPRCETLRSGRLHGGGTWC